MAKKVDFRKFLDPIQGLVLKRVSKFVIPKFRDTILVPKITKYGDLLYNLFHRTFSTFIWLLCILHRICHAIPFLTNNALLDFTKCIQITKLTWVSPATNYFIFIITFYPVLKWLTDYEFFFKSKNDTFCSVCLELQWLKKSWDCCL